MRSNHYQIALILLGAIATAFFGVFLYREAFPEYRIYQNDYQALEKFRSSYTHNPPPDFKQGIKQILLETPDNGPPIIDRCTSCHVALDIPYFSPTKLAYDVNGQMILDDHGIPIKIANEDYIWSKLDQRIAELTDEKVLEQLRSQGDTSAIEERLKEAESLKALKTAQVGDQIYDVTKVLAMHPLMGRETRPFEYHPVANYGCTTCHGGNGRGLTTDKAHGPVFDGQYEIEDHGPTPVFLEKDPLNDPPIARIFNHKPGHDLVFQTTPILVGHLMEAKCMQCHQSGEQSVLNALNTTQSVSQGSQKIIQSILLSYQNELQALTSLLVLKQQIENLGYNRTVEKLNQELNQYLVAPDNRSELRSQLKYLTDNYNKSLEIDALNSKILEKIQQNLLDILGSQELLQQLMEQIKATKKPVSEVVKKFIEAHRLNPEAKGSIFVKANSLELQEALYQHIQDVETSFSQALQDQKVIGSIQTDVDQLTSSYQKGKELYIQQACYACHRIAGFTRGGIGPELTQIGRNYPWYIKESIVWPQADLPNSTMPNYKLDHQELEPLMTFLLGQRGLNDAFSKSEYKRTIAEWEAGKELSWEKPVSPAQMYDLRYSMTVFATEGCASCHRLKGFESNVGYSIEKDQKEVSFDKLYKERQWFTRIFPEELLGSEIVAAIDKYGDEIDQHIAEGVRKGSILEEIEDNHPDTIGSFYTNFRFASRAKNHEYLEQLENEKDPIKKQKIKDRFELYKNRLHRVLMIYIQEYGLGRIIGPRPNWSGIYRSDAWLMEHFKKPTAHIARSIMPVFPFDDTKFYALTHMLDVLAKHNRDWDRKLWDLRGFNPAIAYQLYCSQCHGEYLGGNGPVAPWIYPVPKNLRNAEFLRNYTKERVRDSIIHGIRGTPMPPWGEIAPEKSSTSDGVSVLSRNEIDQLVDWLFSNLPGGTIIPHSQDVPKWNYQPENVIEELHQEGAELKGEKKPTPLGYHLPKGQEYLASNGFTVPNISENTLTVDKNIHKYFDVIPNPPGKPDKNSYYIKKEFYTPENILAGKAFFDIYCSTCHGAEADGSGLRAAVMQDAKPRMLTNLDWLQAQDDLYLLRSIKYGVQGTSMNAWGDQTTSLLRMQLVIYIRSLSMDSKEQKRLSEVLYQTYDAAEFQMDAARVQEVQKIESLEKKLQEAKELQRKLFKNSQTQPALQIQAVEAYQQELKLSEEILREQKKDHLLIQVKEKLSQERKLYNNLGISLLSGNFDKKIFETLLQMIELNKDRYQFHENHSIQMQDEKKQIQKTNELKIMILDQLEQRIAVLDAKKRLVEAKINSPKRVNELKEVEAELKTLMDYKQKFEVDVQSLQLLFQEQQELIKTFNTIDKKMELSSPKDDLKMTK